MSENHIMIELPFKIEIGCLIEFDLGFKVFGYHSISEKTETGYQLYFTLVSIPAESFILTNKKSPVLTGPSLLNKIMN